jgi:ADP-ribose pyrophosphatase YjhB (NUDIX family)
MPRFKMIADGFAFFIKDKKILLVRRFNTGHEDGNYGLPAGHIEDNETLKEGVCREVKEEVGVIVLPSDLHLVHVMHRKGTDIRMSFFFLVTRWLGDLKNIEHEKCDDLQWFSLDNLPSNTISYIRQAITQYQDNELYSEFGWK